MSRFFDLGIASQVTRGQRSLVREQTFEVAFVHHAAAELARGGTDVEDVIRGSHHFRVVFDDEHCVADVAQVFEQANEAIVVARVQTDRRFVEHVERADERRAEIGCELDALSFAAGERRSETIQRQIIESDFNQKRSRRRTSKSILSAIAVCW